jgi:hypothetical protein
VLRPEGYGEHLTAFPWNGETWELRGYETGEVSGIPEEALEEMGCRGRVSDAYQFTSVLAYYRASRVPTTSASVIGGARGRAREPTARDDEAFRRSVRGSDMLRGVRIIGKLDRSMGWVVTIRGSRHEGRAPDSDGVVFRVTHVDGQALAGPIDYPWSPPQPLADLSDLKSATVMDGDVWELKGFERGAILDMPRAASSERGLSSYKFPGGSFSFSVIFYYYKARRVHEAGACKSCHRERGMKRGHA